MMRTAGQAVALGTTAVGLAVGGAAIIMKENPQLKAHIKKVLNRGEKNIQKDKVFTGDVESWKAYPLHEIDEKGLIPPNSTVQIGPQAAHYNAVALINASTIKRSTGYTEVHINAIEGALTALRIADDSSDNPKYYKDAMERLARRVPPGPAREFVNNHLKLHKIGTEEPKAGKI
jgi:NADPH-dependent 7-cyano-7-deazaguanine reductase QueF-like protein